MKWYRLAAEQGHAYSQFNLGAAYSQGEGVAQDYRKATKWYRLAAEQGVAKAQHNLGLLYFINYESFELLRRAHLWASIAAHSGGMLESFELLHMIESKFTKSQLEIVNQAVRECEKLNWSGCEVPKLSQ